MEHDQRHANRRSEQHRRGRQLLLEQTRLVDALIHELVPLDPDGEATEIRVPMLMLQAAGSSVHSVLTLTRERDMGIRDCFAIARATVETALNAAFISASGRDMADLAVRHMRQKRWRDLHREGTAGPLDLSVSRDLGFGPDAIEGLQEALDEFTDGKGRERRQWIDDSMEKRVAAVTRCHERAGLCLGVATFAIYRPASELIHGTYYGVNLFWQGSRETPARTRDEMDELWMTDHFVTLLTALLFATGGALECIAAKNGLDGHVERQDALFAELGLLVDEMADGDPSPDHDFTSSPRR